VTITYKLIDRGIAGHRRLNTGQVTSTSGEGTYDIDPCLRIVENFDYAAVPGGLSGDCLISSPTSFPALMTSGYVELIVLSGATVIWKAIGKV
jgi:hypothetical protein